MRAASLREGRTSTSATTSPSPSPGFGQVLVQVKACGICGSDLHFAKHGRDDVARGEEMRGRAVARRGAPSSTWPATSSWATSSRPRCSRSGPRPRRPRAGTLVTSVPILLSMAGVEPIVYSNEVAGGYGERMLLSAPMLLEVPNGLDPRHAALTEPMAVGLHAVNRSRIARGRGRARARLRPGRARGDRRPAACRGSGTIVAADFSPARRALAATMGAHEVVDPAAEPRSTSGTAPAAGGRSSSSRRSACPASSTARCATRPSGARIVVVGVCMEPDSITPFCGDRQGAQHPVLLRVRPDRVRRHAPLDRRGRHRRVADDHRRGRSRRRRRRVRRARRTRTSTARSSSSPEPDVTSPGDLNGDRIG